MAAAVRTAVVALVEERRSLLLPLLLLELPRVWMPTGIIVSLIFYLERDDVAEGQCLVGWTHAHCD